MSNPPPWPNPDGMRRFQTTHWSVVLAAGDHQNADFETALARLCQDYWYPVYAFVRRRIPDPHSASDTTQAFFARLLEKNYLADARQDRGRFRAFLLTAVQRFMSNEAAKARAQKRGGGRLELSIDVTAGESRFLREPIEESTPEREFDRRWALQLLELVDQRLREEYARADKLGWFEHLKPFATGAAEVAYDQIAELLGMSVGAARTAVYRLRQRFRELIRSEIAQTVDNPEDVDDEVRRLFEALG